jgi:hypothetical protein
MKKNKRKLKGAKKDRYRVDTYVEDGIYNDRFTVTSYHPTLKEARAEAIKEEKYQKKLVDHSMIHIDSAISSNKKRYKYKKAKGAKKMSKNTSYSKGKRWGFAVASSMISTGKQGVHKADKAMKTCYKNAKSGCKRLNKSERAAFRGAADGMYDAFRKSERR